MGEMTPTKISRLFRQANKLIDDLADGLVKVENKYMKSPDEPFTPGYFLKATHAHKFDFVPHGLGFADVGAAAEDHNHDTAYSGILHNHDTAYSAIGHDHDGRYSRKNHEHTEYSTAAYDLRYVRL